MDNTGATTPAGIKSLNKIEMKSLKKIVDTLSMTDAKSTLEEDSILNLFHEADKEYKDMKKSLSVSEEENNTNAEKTTDDKTITSTDTQKDEPEQTDKQESETDKQESKTDKQEGETDKQEGENSNGTQNESGNGEDDQTGNAMKEKYECKIASLQAEIESLQNAADEETKKMQVELQHKDDLCEEKENELKITKLEVTKQVEEVERKMQMELQRKENLCVEKEKELINTKLEVTKQEKQLEGLEDNIEKLTQQVENLKLRLSHIAGAKLTDDNPAITDLGDPNRPMKIAEQFCELYDNEWTDALEMLQQDKGEREAIDTLLSIVKSCFQFCKEKSTSQMKNLVCAGSLCEETGCNYSTSDIDKEVVKAVKDLRKLAGLEDFCTESLKKGFRQSDLYKYLSVTEAEPLAKYIDTSLRCCWLSCVQDPPVVLGFDVEENSKFDPIYTKEYTRTGKYVEYLVWPCMLRCESGSLLSKGVVQCIDKEDSVENQGGAPALEAIKDTSEEKPQTENKEYVNSEPGDAAAETAKSGEYTVETAESDDAVETAKSDDAAIVTANPADAAVGTTTSADAVAKTVQSGDAAIDTTESGDTVTKTAESGHMATETEKSADAVTETAKSCDDVAKTSTKEAGTAGSGGAENTEIQEKENEDDKSSDAVENNTENNGQAKRPVNRII